MASGYAPVSEIEQEAVIGGGATRPLLRDGDAEELHGDPEVGPQHKI